MRHVSEQMAQSKKLPTVLVTSDIVGRSALPLLLPTGRKNHRYSVPEFAKWADIVEANEKSFAIAPSTDCIVSLAAKTKKVGGLYLALNGAAVRPTDAVDAKKEYSLVAMDGSTPVTPVEPEVTPVTPE